jgi:hypothetical protein
VDRVVTATTKHRAAQHPPRHLRAKVPLRLATTVRHQKKKNSTTFPVPMG